MLVKTKEEVQMIKEHLLNLYHSKSTNFDREYNLEAILNTYILAVDDLDSIIVDTKTVRLEDLPLSSMLKPSKIQVSDNTYQLVKEAVDVASNIAYEESENAFKVKGDHSGVGWATVVTYVSNSEITQALIDLGLASSFGGGYYCINLSKSYPVQSLDVDEVGKIKAAEYLTKTLNQAFTTHWRWD